MRRFWTTREDAILREAYPRGGARAVRAELPHRSVHAVRSRASLLKLPAPIEIQRGIKPRIWESSPAIEAEIRRVYAQAPTPGAIDNLAARIHRPRWWVGRQAAKMGIVQPRFRAPDWTEAEDELLERLAHLDAEQAMRRMRKAGFARTTTAVAVRRKRLGIKVSAARTDAGLYTANGLAKLLGIDIHQVLRWIEREGLPARRRGTARTEVQGGDQWEIREPALRQWMKTHAQLIDLRKADVSRFWFINLLAN
jgi:hypothetical protein